VSALSPLALLIGCLYSAMCVGMIVYRIWNAQDDSRGLVGDASGAQYARMTPLDSVIHIVIDSGLGYTLVTLTLFFSQVARSNALYITSGAVSLYIYILIMCTNMILILGLKEIQAVGIAFNLINIRVANLRNEEQEATRMASNGRAGISTTPHITFAAVSVPSYELRSTTSDPRETGEREKSGTNGLDHDSRSSV